MNKLIIIGRKGSFYRYLIFLFCLGLVIPFFTYEPRIKLGDYKIYCNPRAKINFKKSYHLQLWDYNWPLGEGKTNYSNYLKKAIREFGKEYPNIRVDLTLLDLYNGPGRLEKALKANEAPDVYCSPFTVPSFNFKRQIPVGPYLKRKEMTVYPASIRSELEYDKVLCSFPRWAIPGLWIGNSSLLSEAGVSPGKIQTSGWTWEEFALLAKKYTNRKYLLVGSLGPGGFFTQLLMNSGSNSSAAAIPSSAQSINLTVDYLESLIQQKAIPEDCDQHMLDRFLSGQAVILAGVRPALYNYLIQKLAAANCNWRPVLLPVPVYRPGREILLMELSAISIFHNKKTAGNDHLTAAVKLGQFLSCYQDPNPCNQMMVMPVHSQSAEDWLKNNGLHKKLFYRFIETGQFRILSSQPGYIQKVYPVLLNLMAKKTTAAEAKAKLLAP